MKIVITKNCQDGNRMRLKGTTLEVTPGKAEQLIKKKLAKELFKKAVKIPIEKVETAEKNDLKETR